MTGFQCGIAGVSEVVPKKYKGFFKDHDFIELGYFKDEYIYVDPTIFDMTWNACETIIKK